MSHDSKRINFYYRLFSRTFFFYSVFFLISGFSFAQQQKISDFWVIDDCDEVCKGSWIGPILEKRRGIDDGLEVQFSNSKIDSINKSLLGDNVQIFGKDFFLKAQNLSMDLKNQEKIKLDGDISLSTEMITLFAQEMFFYPKKKHGQAKKIEFMIFPWNIHGWAKRAIVDQKNFTLEEVTYSQCPINKKEWEIHAEKILWNDSLDQLKISHPSLSIFNKHISPLPSVEVKKDKGSDKLVALPQIRIGAQRGLQLSFPKLINNERSSTLFIPEFSSNYGFSGMVEYKRDQQKIIGMAELFSFQKTWDKYLGLKNTFEYKKESLFFDYDLNFVSNDTAVYRYPDIISHQNKQVMVNFISAKKKFSSGYLKLYCENLYEFEQKKIRHDNLIETPLKIIHFYQNPKMNLWQTLSYIQQKKGNSFHRYKVKTQLFTFLPGFLNFHTIFDDSQASLFQLYHHLPLLQNDFSEHSSLNIDFSWRYSRCYQTLQRVESRFLPLSFESFIENSWHQGDDWMASYAYLTGKLSLEPAQNYLLEFAASILLSHPNFFDEQWSYFSPFKTQEERFSALAGRLTAFNDLSASLIVSNSFDELVNFELKKKIRQKNYEAYFGYYFHNYFPLEGKTKTVNQLHLGGYTKAKKPWEYFFYSSIDLSPVKLHELSVGIENNRCCWKNSFGIKFSQEYSVEDKKEQFTYGLSFQIEIYTLGFLSLGNLKDEKRKRFNDKPWSNFSYSKAYGS